jgi:hypothetical protein
VHKADDTLRDILEHSPAGRAGLTLKWLVDAAILMHAADLAKRHPKQITVASELGIGESRLAHMRTRVLGSEWKWSQMRDADCVALAIWSSLAQLASDGRNPEIDG